MSSTYLSLHYHIVFGTKDRVPLIHADWRNRLHEYLGGTIRGLGGFPEGVGGVADHVHLLVGLKATHCLADVMRELKKAASVSQPLAGGRAQRHHRKRTASQRIASRRDASAMGDTIVL